MPSSGSQPPTRMTRVPLLSTSIRMAAAAAVTPDQCGDGDGIAKMVSGAKRERERGGQEGSDHGEGNERGHEASSGMASDDSSFVEPGHPPVFEVVLDEVVTRERVLASGQCEQEQGQAEGDHDRRERQRLRERVRHLFGVSSDRPSGGLAGRAPGTQQCEHGGVTEHRESENDPTQRARGDEIGADRDQPGHRQDEGGAHDSPSAVAEGVGFGHGIGDTGDAQPVEHGQRPVRPRSRRRRHRRRARSRLHLAEHRRIVTSTTL